ncbi:hypothetical protein C8A03DRAFT_29386 [Achaetomium macrosporum]|uniref:Cyclin-dependent kinase n=1 Tax=Achaetomium macrosporum TaxID=79813 RepID=A0AAN7CKI1_9PEZI|nr:hypothetical protein C8A03DRAFT_29386 [Achaetomium macrosporum]
MYASPVKRRVLGALDPNACSPKASPSKSKHDMKQTAPSPVNAKPVGPRQTEPVPSSGAASPTSASPRKPERDMDSRKRLSPTPAMRSRADGSDNDERAPKRPCLGNTREGARLQEPPAHTGTPPSSTSTIRTTVTRGRSASPDTSSLFDISAVDNSQATIVTEPDATAPAAAAPAVVSAPLVAPPPAPRRRLTREQAREKAEILRLRLGLASYKVRTGQTDVPLERLEARLGLQRSFTRAGAGSFSHGHGHGHGHGYAQQGPSGQTTTTSVSASFPPPSGHGHGTRGRRPLPGAPVRRTASISIEQQQANQDRAARHATEDDGSSSRLFGAGGDRRGQQLLQYEQRRQRARQEGEGEEGEEEEDVVRHGAGRRQSVNGGLPRLRSPTADLGPLSPRRRSLVEDGEEEDLEGGDDMRRGGAASGLLSLARS